MFHKQIRITLVIAISTVFVMIIKYFKLPYIESKSKISLDDSFKYSNKMTKISSKWIVVTSINEPTLQIKNLARIKNFQLLVVGDKKSKNNWHCNNTIYLSLSKQIDLNFKSSATTPLNSYTRKNLGYLYAIKHGAKYIYDTDDDNSPLVDLNEYFNFENSDYGLQFENALNQSSNVLNPYAHFGQPLIWPRGFPLTYIQQKNASFKYVCGKRKTSFVQQGVVNGDPDVDAIFRLTKSMQYKKIDVKFDPTSPSIQYPIGIMSPYNSQNTFFHYEAFWSLYLPRTVAFRLTDIWRSYWSQRLMWLLNGTITFNGPNAYQLRNSHSYLADFKDEQTMYLETERLVEFLYEWNCENVQFYECVLDLSRKMVDKGFWLDEEVTSIQNWLYDLTEIGYEQPIMTELKKRESIYNYYYYPVKYTPSFQATIDFSNLYGNIEKTYDTLTSLNYLDRFCLASNVKLNFSTNLFLSERRHYSKISLVIKFDSTSKLENILLLKHLYESYFKDIVFCGPNLFNFYESLRINFKRFDSFTFIEVDEAVNEYICMKKAIELNLVTNGYLLIKNDVILNYWLLSKFDIEKIWFPFNLECQSKQRLIDWIYLKNISDNQLENRQVIENFLSNIQLNANKKDQTKCSKIFYLPKNKFKDFHYLSEVFKKYYANQVESMEAVSLLNGLEEHKNIEFLNGTLKFYDNFETNLHGSMSVFRHMGKLLKHDEIKIVCKFFIQDKIDYDFEIKFLV